MNMKIKSQSRSAPAETIGKGEVICATDFSIHATRAAEAATAIAKRMGVPLRLVHVVECASFPKEIESVRLQWRRSGRKQLASEAAHLRRLGAKVSTELLEGHPEAELLRVAQRPGSRLLVMTSRRHLTVSRVLMGSVSERTAESSPIPTLIIRDEKPFVAWAEGRRSLNVFIAADFTASAEGAMGWVKELRRIGSCNVVAGYVDFPLEARGRLGLESVASIWENPPELQRVLERDLRRKLSEVLGDTSARVRVQAGWGAPEFNLIQIAHEERADLLLVGTHQRHGWSRLFHSSVSRGILHYAPISVACVPVSAAKAVAHIPEYHRVLVATDLSALSNHTISSAYSVLFHGGVVRLVHVVPPFSAAKRLIEPKGRKGFTRRGYQKLVDDLSRKLCSLVPEEATESGIQTDVAVLQSRDAADTICQDAERFGANLICIGSHGRSGLAAAALGSVAQKVISHSRRPVLVVRGPPA